MGRNIPYRSVVADPGGQPFRGMGRLCEMNPVSVGRGVERARLEAVGADEGTARAIKA